MLNNIQTVKVNRRDPVGHSQSEKAESRERILDAAARQIREGGLESLSIAELMKSANLTHGGFYGHFPSRAALISAALDQALERGAADFLAMKSVKADSAVKAIVNQYLKPKHRDDRASGCTISALASDVGRAGDEELRANMMQRLEDSFAIMASAFGDGPEADAAAVTAWCAMVGALNLSRVFQGTERSDQILQLARRFILDLEARGLDAGRPEQSNTPSRSKG
jgi:TetR/AcrR family transcriptional repressor of nem operon